MQPRRPSVLSQSTSSSGTSSIDYSRRGSAQSIPHDVEPGPLSSPPASPSALSFFTAADGESLRINPDSPFLYSSRRISFDSPMNGSRSRHLEGKRPSNSSAATTTSTVRASPAFQDQVAFEESRPPFRRAQSSTTSNRRAARRPSRSSLDQQESSTSRAGYSFLNEPPAERRRASRDHELAQSNSRRPSLMPRSALRSECFGLDFSFLDEEPPVRPTFAAAAVRRGSVEQSRASRERRRSRDKPEISSTDDTDSEGERDLPAAPRSFSSGSALPFPSRPKNTRAASSSDSFLNPLPKLQPPRQPYNPGTFVPGFNLGVSTAATTGSDRRPSTFSSLSMESTDSSLRSMTFSQGVLTDMESPTSSNFSAGVQDPPPAEDLDRRKRLAAFLDQTAEAMEGGRSLAMVLPESRPTELTVAKSMSELAMAADVTSSPRLADLIEYRHPFNSGPSSISTVPEVNILSPRTNSSLRSGDSASLHDSLTASSPSTPIAPPNASKMRSGLDPSPVDVRRSVYFTPEPTPSVSSTSGDERESDSQVSKKHLTPAMNGGLGFNIEIKTESDLSSSPSMPRRAPLAAPDRSPSTVRASSPSESLSTSTSHTMEATRELDAKIAKVNEKRKRTIQELIETEAAYATDMAVVRDIYLARAKGTDIGVIADRVMSSGLGLGSSARPPAVPARVSKVGSIGIIPEDGSPSSLRSEARRSTLTIDPRRASAAPSLISKLEQRRATLAANQPVTNTSQALITDKDLHIIFANLEDVAAFAEKFALVLASADGHSDDGEDRIGRAFCEMIPRIEKIYSTYCSRHDRAIHRLSELEPVLKSYLSECRTLSHGRTNAWDLGSLLIKPVQRVLKYPLLLDQILTMTPDSHPDRAALLRANDRMLGVAEHINEQKKRNRSSVALRKEMPRRETRSLSSSVTKKFLRATAPKPSKPTAAEYTSERDDMFDTLAHLVDSTRSAVLRFSNEMRDWSKSTRSSLEAQVTMVDGWMEAYSHMSHDTGDTLYSRLGFFLDEVLDPIIDESWREVDHEIRGSLLLKTDHLLSLFESPRSFIAKRNDKLLEHHRYLAKKMPIDRRGSEEFIDLSTRLLDELPRFLGSVTRYYDIIVEHFGDVQEAYQEAVQESWDRFANHFASDHRRKSTAQQHSINDMMNRLAAGLGVPLARERSIMAFPPARRRFSRTSTVNTLSTGVASPSSDRRSFSAGDDRRISRTSVPSERGTSSPQRNRASVATYRNSILSDSSTPSFTVSSTGGSSSGAPTTPPAIPNAAGGYLKLPPPPKQSMQQQVSQQSASLPNTSSNPLSARYDHPLPSVPVHELNLAGSNSTAGESSQAPSISTYRPASSSKTATAGRAVTSGSSCDESDNAKSKHHQGRQSTSASGGDTSDSSTSSAAMHDAVTNQLLRPYTVYVEAGENFEYSDEADAETTGTETEGEYDDIGEGKLYTAEAMQDSGSPTNPPAYRSGFPILVFKMGERIDVEVEEADKAEGGAGWLLGRKHDARGQPSGPLGWARTEFFALLQEDDEE